MQDCCIIQRSHGVREEVCGLESPYSELRSKARDGENDEEKTLKVMENEQGVVEGYD